ncbi:MAG: hypothetical protein JF588_11480 [Caulobacterales bacterium]|nr:hypothetical protein [Caulobacterales bacterium]
MTTTAIQAKGVLLHVDTAGDGSFAQKIGMLKEIQKPNATVDELDATDMDSLAKEFVTGLTDFGEVPCTLNWKPGDATDKYIEDWRAGGNENRPIRITTPNAKTYIVSVFIKSYGGTMKVGQLMESSLTFRCSGDVGRNF